MAKEKVVKSAEMFFQEGSSDKVYNVTLVEVSKGVFTVRVAWGRRDTPLKTGTKAVEVTAEKAEKAYDKVVRQKTKKGYELQTAELKPAAVAPPEGQGSGSKVSKGDRRRLKQKAQLLNTVDDEELAALLADEKTVAQQKLDGMRLLVHIREEEIVATNRDGYVTRLAKIIDEALAPAPIGTVFDGEFVREPEPMYWLFDMLSYGEEDLRELGYVERYERLVSVGVETEVVVVVPLADTPKEKRRLFKKLQKQNAEGVVFKAASAGYEGGRPASGGPQRKYKFIKTADVVITENVGNAYQMAVFVDETLRDVGKVFAGTTNSSRAELDSLLADGERIVAEVKYLYATDDDILYQPVFVRLRDDKEADDCVIGQLVHTNREGITDV